MQFKLSQIFDVTQWFKHGDHPAVVARVPIDGTPENSQAVLPTPFGEDPVNPGDYIVHNSEYNKNAVFSPEEFHSKFEEVKNEVESSAQKEMAKLQSDALGIPSAEAQTLHFTGMI